MDEKKTTTQPLPAEQQAAQSENTQAEVAPTPASTPIQSKIILWIIAALLLIFLTVGSIYLFQLTQLKTPVPATTPPPQVVPTTPPLPTPTPEELAVPTVSEDTSLDILEKEINETQVASPDSDIEELESEASQL